MKKLALFTVAFLAFSNIAGPVFAEENLINIDLTGKSVVATFQSEEVTSGDPGISGEVLLEDKFTTISVGENSVESLQLLITVDSVTSPDSYDFILSGVEKLEELSWGPGSIFKAVGQGGETLGWLAAPWAHDANGKMVSTHYTFSNGVLTQHIDLDSDNLVYPITADPYLGKNLIKSVKATLINNSYYAISVAVSDWLWQVYATYTVAGKVLGYTIAYQISVNDGWDEVMNKIGSRYGSQFRAYVASKPTFEDQYDCHSWGAPALYYGVIFGTDPHPTWDLEGFRSHVQDIVKWTRTSCSW